MLKKKICMLGSFGVGKSSLVSRFVTSMFAEKYHTTVGVKIDKKVLDVNGRELTMVLWDMAGEDDKVPVRLNQVQDAAGYLLVTDGLRSKTLDVALDIQKRIEGQLGPKPFLLLANKADEKERWEVSESVLAELGTQGWRILETSAKSGQNVEEAFRSLAAQLLTTSDDDSDEN